MSSGCVYAFIEMLICIYECVCVCVCVSFAVSFSPRVCVCVYVCVCVCVCVLYGAQGRPDILIDRFDGRGALEMLDEFDWHGDERETAPEVDVRARVCNMDISMCVAHRTLGY